MADVKSSEDMETELKKMIGNKQTNNMTEVKKTHEIEADLKRMLNMTPQGVVVTKEDLLNIKTGKEKTGKVNKHTCVMYLSLFLSDIHKLLTYRNRKCTDYFKTSESWMMVNFSVQVSFFLYKYSFSLTIQRIGKAISVTFSWHLLLG